MPHVSRRSICVVCFARGWREVPQEGERWEGLVLPRFLCGNFSLFYKNYIDKESRGRGAQRWSYNWKEGSLE